MGKNKTNWMLIVGIGLLVASAVFVLWFLMRGETKVEGAYPGDVKETSLACESYNISYPIFTLDDATERRTNIKVLFDDGKIKSISLVYALYYNNLEASRMSESHNHADMNISFGHDGLSADEFSATYSVQSDKMIMTLYAKKKEFSPVATKYFLAEGLNADSSLGDFIDYYTGFGFKCSESE